MNPPDWVYQFVSAKSCDPRKPCKQNSLFTLICSNLFIQSLFQFADTFTFNLALALMVLEIRWGQLILTCHFCSSVLSSFSTIFIYFCQLVWRVSRGAPFFFWSHGSCDSDWQTVTCSHCTKTPRTKVFHPPPVLLLSIRTGAASLPRQRSVDSHPPAEMMDSVSDSQWLKPPTRTPTFLPSLCQHVSCDCCLFPSTAVCLCFFSLSLGSSHRLLLHHTWFSFHILRLCMLSLCLSLSSAGGCRCGVVRSVDHVRFSV